MTDTILVFNETNSFADTIEQFYISPDSGNGTKIKAFTAANNSDSSKSYKAYIYPSSGADPQAVIPLTIVVRDRKDYGPSIIGQLIPAGGSLRMETSDIDGLNFYVTGQEV